MVGWRNPGIVGLVLVCLLVNGESPQAGPDCNGNGTPDGDDIAMGTSQDCDGNGIPDECDTAVTFSSVDISMLSGTALAAVDLDNDGDIDVISGSTPDDTFAWSENVDGSGSIWLDHPIGSVDPPYSIFPADIDGDGDLDLFAGLQVVSANPSDRIVWYENLDGAGTFGPEQLVHIGEGELSVIGQDFDGDGDVDLLAALWSDGRIAWFENLDSAGGFGPLQVIWTEAQFLPRSAFAGDVDGDGDADALSGSDDGKIAWYENTDGGGTFGPQRVLFDDGISDGDVVIASDLDGDTDLDVVAVLEGSGEARVVWFENLNGNGDFGTERLIATGTGSVPFPSIFVTDMNGDGDADLLAIANFGLPDESVAWYENTDGAGTFGPKLTIELSFDDLDTVVAADVDGDGDFDVLTGARNGSGDCCTDNGKTPGCEDTQCESAICNVESSCCQFFWDEFCADLAASSLSCVCTGLRWYDNSTGDCNGNGTPDDCDVATSTSPDCNGTGIPDECELSTGASSDCNGNGLPDECDVAGGSSTDCNGNGLADECEPDCNGNGVADECDIAAGSTDVDRNGVPDECDPDCNGNGVPDGADLENGTSEDCNDNRVPDDCDLASSSSADCNTNGAPDECETEASFVVYAISLDLEAYQGRGVAAADLDGDGDIDALSASSGDDKIAWYENTDGAGTFGAQRLISTEVHGTNDVLTADLDGDGDPDVISVSGFDDKIAWYENINMGLGINFGPQRIISTAGDFPVGVAHGDLDGDGDIDAVSISIQDDVVAWFENEDGLGNFVAEQVVFDGNITGGGPAAVSVADLDGDDDLDLIVGFSGFGPVDRIAWFENVNSTGFFGPLREITEAVDFPVAVIAADLDGDGDRDVLSASIGDDKLAWYENVDGSGSFGPQRIVSLQGSGLSSLAVDDVNGDGAPDVVAAFRDGDRVGWYENIGGTGTFALERPLATLFDAPVAVTTADVDGDGILDALTASESDLGNSNCCIAGNGGIGCSDRSCEALICAQFPWCCEVFPGWDAFCVAAALADPTCAAACSDGSPGTIAWHQNQSNDCNANGAPDTCDVDSGLSSDCNLNSILDECESDCNGNGLADDCDIAGGASQDCDVDGVPDECEPDCNGNGLADDCDIDGGSSQDCDADGVPDECGPDCNGNGEADSCDVATGTSPDCDTNGVPDECDPDCNASGQPDLCDVLTGNSDDCNGNFYPDECDVAAGDSEDCTNDGIPDECEADCNGNGIADSCDLAAGGDCDLNGVPDECELAVSFDRRVVVETIDENWTMWPSDVDGDGDTDVVSISIDADNVEWHENVDGLGTFAPRFIATAPAGVFPIAADLDGDGDDDILAGISSTIGTFENLDGVGTFGPQQTIVTGLDIPYYLTVADLDGDGDTDIPMVTTDGDEVAWYENVDGTGTSWAKIVIDSIDAPVSVLGVDLDADGDTDVLSIAAGTDELIWYANVNGVGTAWQSNVISSDVDAGVAYAADLDGDGDKDVVYVDTGTDELAWHENLDGHGTFGPGRLIGPFSGLRFADAGDLDGDGDIDLAAGALSADTLAWYENLDGLGNFGARNIVSDDLNAPNQVFVVDIDGDRHMDLLTERNDIFQEPGAIEWYENRSEDCDANGIPDACEPDCNANGITDSCDLRLLTSLDCNANNTPDECDTTCAVDCDTDGDGCLDEVDTNVLDPSVCADTDRDGCDDCSSGIFDPLADGVNSDTDAICDLGDCDPADNGVWTTPGPTGTLRLADSGTETVLQWLAPASAGSVLVGYDTLRSDVGSDFTGSASCIESDGNDTTSSDAVIPGGGSVRFYLVRAVNDCPAGEGSLGVDSGGTPRPGLSCP